MKHWKPEAKAILALASTCLFMTWSIPGQNSVIAVPGHTLHAGAVAAVANQTPAQTTPGTTGDAKQGSAQKSSPPQKQASPNPQPVAPNPYDSIPQQPAPLPPPSPTSEKQSFTPYAPWPTAKLRIRVIDGRTQKPIEGAEVVVIETEQRMQTGKDGLTQWVDVPIIRNPRYRPLVAELHGQLGVISYKNGYRDSVHLGVRMHDGIRNETTVWMYKLGPGDTRIEPVLYEVPYHHIWLVELADKFRSKNQPGEGPERP